MSKTINAIVEGCMPDTPKKLMYCGIEMVIPENSQILLSDHDIHSNRYLLYAKTEKFSEFEILHNPYFDCNLNFQDSNKSFSGGWPLRSFEPNFRWIFDAQRSLTTREGRIYIKSTYFHKDWRWYLDAVPTILKECGEMFRGERSEDYFYNHSSRAF